MLNPNVTLAQAGKHFKISIIVASYYMKKFGYSYKKNVYLHGSKTRNKRKISTSDKFYTKENLVYIYENGIEMSICKDRLWSKKWTHVSSKKSGKYYERQIRIRKSMKGIIQQACKR
ncbi:hypothetical protein [Orientia tsutsugamushi]|uniref:hypothetical protein n=1 Tax=Orientia tsutsugamushi TaxID=784 RepID=UPI000D5A5201|nr:IS630 family transposase [Orientia tsutsugamushi]